MTPLRWWYCPENHKGGTRNTGVYQKRRIIQRRVPQQTPIFKHNFFSTPVKKIKKEICEKKEFPRRPPPSKTGPRLLFFFAFTRDGVTRVRRPLSRTYPRSNPMIIHPRGMRLVSPKPLSGFAVSASTCLASAVSHRSTSTRRTTRAPAHDDARRIPGSTELFARSILCFATKERRESSTTHARRIDTHARACLPRVRIDDPTTR